MKKILVIVGIVVVLVASVCTFAFAAFPTTEPAPTVYRGEKWSFGFGEDEYETITVIPEDRPEPKVYGNGYVYRVEEKENQYNIILLDK